MQRTVERLPTVRVVTDETSEGFVIINASEFDPTVHERHASDPGETGEALQKVPEQRAPESPPGSTLRGVQPIPTIRIIDPETRGGFVIINQSDFDPSIHTAFDDVETDEGDEAWKSGSAESFLAELPTLSFAELRKRAKTLDLNASGNRATLETTIREAVLKRMVPSDLPPAA